MKYLYLQISSVALLIASWYFLYKTLIDLAVN